MLSIQRILLKKIFLYILILVISSFTIYHLLVRDNASTIVQISEAQTAAASNPNYSIEKDGTYNANASVTCKIGGNTAGSLPNGDQYWDTRFADKSTGQILRDKGINFGWYLVIINGIDDLIKQKALIKDLKKYTGANTIIRLCVKDSCGINTIDEAQRLAKKAWELAEDPDVPPFWLVAGHNEPNAAEYNGLGGGPNRTPEFEAEFMNTIITELRTRVKDDLEKPKGGNMNTRAKINLLSPVIDIGNDQGAEGNSLEYIARMNQPIKPSGNPDSKGIPNGALWGELAGFAVNLYYTKDTNGEVGMQRALKVSSELGLPIYITETGLSLGDGRITDKEANISRYQNIMQFVNHPQIKAMLLFNGVPLAKPEEKATSYDACMANNYLPDDPISYPHSNSFEGCNWTGALDAGVKACQDSLIGYCRAKGLPDNCDYYQTYIFTCDRLETDYKCVQASFCSGNNPQGDLKEPTTALNPMFKAYYESQILRILDEAGCSNKFTMTCPNGTLVKTSSIGEVTMSADNSDAVRNSVTDESLKSMKSSDPIKNKNLDKTITQLSGYLDLPDRKPIAKPYKLSLGYAETCNDPQNSNFPCLDTVPAYIEYDKVVQDIEFSGRLVTTAQVEIPTMKFLASTEAQGTDELTSQPYGYNLRMNQNQDADLTRDSDLAGSVSWGGGKSTISIPELGKAYNLYSIDPTQNSMCTINYDISTNKYYCNNLDNSLSLSFLTRINNDVGYIGSTMPQDFLDINYNGFVSAMGERTYNDATNIGRKDIALLNKNGFLKSLKTSGGSSFLYFTGSTSHWKTQNYSYIEGDYSKTLTTQYTAGEIQSGEQLIGFEEAHNHKLKVSDTVAKGELIQHIDVGGVNFFEPVTEDKLWGAGNANNIKSSYYLCKPEKPTIAKHTYWDREYGATKRTTLNYKGEPIGQPEKLTKIYGGQEIPTLYFTLTPRGWNVLCLQYQHPTLLPSNVITESKVRTQQQILSAKESNGSMVVQYQLFGVGVDGEAGENGPDQDIQNWKTEYHFLLSKGAIPASIETIGGGLRILRTMWENGQRLKNTLASPTAITMTSSLGLNTDSGNDTRICYRNVGVEAKTYTRMYTVSKSMEYKKGFENTDVCVNPQSENLGNFKRPLVEPVQIGGPSNLGYAEVNPNNPSNVLGITDGSTKTSYDYALKSTMFPWLGTVTAVNQKISLSDFSGVTSSKPMISKCGTASGDNDVMCLCKPTQIDSLSIYLCQNGMLTYDEAVDQKLITPAGKDRGPEFLGKDTTGKDKLFNCKFTDTKEISSGLPPVCESSLIPSTCTSKIANSNVSELFAGAAKSAGIETSLLQAFWISETSCRTPSNYDGITYDEFLKGDVRGPESSNPSEGQGQGSMQINLVTSKELYAKYKTDLENCMVDIGMKSFNLDDPDKDRYIMGPNVCMGAITVKIKMNVQSAKGVSCKEENLNINDINFCSAHKYLSYVTTVCNQSLDDFKTNGPDSNYEQSYCAYVAARAEAIRSCPKP